MDIKAKFDELVADESFVALMSKHLSESPEDFMSQKQFLESQEYRYVLRPQYS